MRFPATRLWTMAAVLLLLSARAYGQFSGSVSLGVNSSSNASGTDTTSPDRPFLPSVDLQYRQAISRLNSLTFEAATSPYFSSVTSDNSYFKYDLALTGEFFLSEDLPRAPELPSVPNSTVPSSAPQSAIKPQQPAQPGPSSPPHLGAKDSISVVGEQLALLSARLDSLEIDDSRLSEDSVDAATDLKDSLSESILAVSEVLSAETYSESIQKVLTEELDADLLLLKQIPLQSILKDSIATAIWTARSVLSRALAASDLVVVPVEPLDTTKQQLPPAIVLAIKKPAAAETQNAPIITLVNPTTDIHDLSSADFTPKEDAPPRTTTTLATVLRVPVQFEQQQNSLKYEAFSYSQFVFEPRLALYAGEHFGFGAEYGFSSNFYPNDTLYTYTEHKFRLDAHASIGDAVVIGAQFGMNFANYSHPFDSVFKGPRGKLISEYTEPANFNRTELGLHATFFIGGSSIAGAAIAISRSSQLRPYLVNALLGRSKIGGQAADDPYSYELTRYILYASTTTFWELTPSIDVAFEKRAYGKGLLRTNVGANIPARNDNGTIVTFDLSRLFPFEERLLSIFDAITPELNIEYTKYGSSIKTYAYKDLSTTLAVTLGF